MTTLMHTKFSKQNKLQPSTSCSLFFWLDLYLLNIKMSLKYKFYEKEKANFISVTIVI
jgi:hypothetical protein